MITGGGAWCRRGKKPDAAVGQHPIDVEDDQLDAARAILGA